MLVCIRKELLVAVIIPPVPTVPYSHRTKSTVSFKNALKSSAEACMKFEFVRQIKWVLSKVSLFSSIFPLCVSPDSTVSLLSCCSGTVKQREFCTKKTVALEDIHLACLTAEATYQRQMKLKEYFINLALHYHTIVRLLIDSLK